MREEWKYIGDWDDYMISNHGRVKSLRRNLILKPDPYAQYAMITLQRNGDILRRYIHVLVAQHFIPNSRPKIAYCVNHKDGDKRNNHESNLEWVTRKENMKHAWDTGLVNTKGEGNGRAKLTELKVKAIKLLGSQLSNRELAEIFGVGKTAINDILSGKTWKHINNTVNT